MTANMDHKKISALWHLRLAITLLAVAFAVAFGGAAVAGTLQVEVEVETVRAGHPFWLAIAYQPEANEFLLPTTASVDTGFHAKLPDGFALRDIRRPAPAIASGPPAAGDGVGQSDGEGDDRNYFLVEIVPPDRLSEAEYVFDLSYFGQHAEVRLAAGSGTPRQDVRPVFRHARARLPIPSPWPVRVTVGGSKFDLEFTPEGLPLAVASVRFVADRDDLMNPEIPAQVQIIDGKVTIKGRRAKGAPYIKEVTGVVVLAAADDTPLGAYRIDGWNSAAPPRDPLLAVDVDDGRVSFHLALLFAFLGGLILNLMPCVFPVLSIKLFGMVKAGAQSAARMRADGLAYTAGILASFAVVALVLISLQQVGQQIGWGFQLQSPGFVLALILLMFALSLNLAGMFEIPAIQLGSLGAPGKNKTGTGASFSTGVLTTVLATPCTAPLMAPALGFALSQSTAVALAVFLALGLGLASPFLLISMAPALHKHMPKPGPWMEKLRKALAVPMLATVLWLGWVLSLQAGVSGLIAAGVGLLIVLGLVIIVSRRQMRGLGIGTVALLATAALIALGAWAPGYMQRAGPGVAATLAEGEVPYSRELLAGYRREGRPVFLDFTAAWCITCIVQDRLVIDTPEFRTFLADNGITLMVADWTNPSDEIASILKSFGRNGIPFYVFYPADPNRSPVPLPEIFTTATIIEILSDNM